MKKVQLLLGVALIAASFTSCKSEEEKMAEKSFDRYEKYVDSVNTVSEAEALTNWKAIQEGYENRMSEADMALIDMKDQTMAQDRLDKTKMKYTEFKTKVEASAPKPLDRKTVIRNSYFGNGIVAGDSMDFSWVNKDNILKVYDDFYNEFLKNKDSYSREDFDEIKALYEALDSRKNTVEKEGLTTSDNNKIASIKFKFAPKFKWERMGAKAEENADAKK
jgi:cell division protein YceG involved in septum cleavage